MGTPPMSFEKKRVNIVELPGWKPYDSGGNIMNWASDNAYEEFRHTSKGDLLELVSDMFGRAKPGPLEWSPIRFEITEEDYDLIWEELQPGTTTKLESTKLAIIDALQWMWEEAYMPDDGDIELAIERTAETMLDTHGIDTSLWEPLLEIEGWDEAIILQTLMARVSYERQQNYYDRFVVFDFGEVGAVEKLLKIVYADPEELSEKETVRQLKVEFEALADDYMDLFFAKLGKVMSQTDAPNRTDFKKHWKAVLGDKELMKTVGKEIREFILEARAKGGEA